MFLKNIAERKKQKEELGRIFRENGCYSNEYVEAFTAFHPKMSSDEQMILTSIYIEMGRLDDAKKSMMNTDFGVDKLIDSNAKAKKVHLQIMLDLAEGLADEAKSLFTENTRFMDKNMKNPFASNIAGDYYVYAASFSTIIDGDRTSEDTEKYLARLREWCDTYPRNRLLYEIAEVWLAYVQPDANKEEAEATAAECRKSILDFDGFNYEWERTFYLNRLDRVIKHAV